MPAIEKIIKNGAVTTLYQPIYDLVENKVIGYEALSRGPNGLYFFPDRLFAAANQHNCLAELEIMCAYKALERYSGKALLFINFSSMTAIRYYKEITKNFKNSVIEISENNGEPHKRFIKTIESFQKSGIKVALDDFGNGSKDFYRLAEISADFIKIDKGLVYGMTSYFNSTYYKSIVEYILKLAFEKKIKVIAEGVETEKQLKQVKNTGITLAQGFFFSKPSYPENIFKKELI